MDVLYNDLLILFKPFSVCLSGKSLFINVRVSDFVSCNSFGNRRLIGGQTERGLTKTQVYFLEDTQHRINLNCCCVSMFVFGKTNWKIFLKFYSKNCSLLMHTHRPEEKQTINCIVFCRFWSLGICLAQDSLFVYNVF